MFFQLHPSENEPEEEEALVQLLEELKFEKSSTA
jgi:hypothetical protein